MYHEFEIPDDREFLEQIGVAPEYEESEGVRTVTFDGCGDRIRLSCDALGRSIRVRWSDKSEREILDIFREGAKCMRIISEGGRTWIPVEFDLTEFTAELRVDVFPVLKVTERVLFA